MVFNVEITIKQGKEVSDKAFEKVQKSVEKAFKANVKEFATLNGAKVKVTPITNFGDESAVV